MRNVIILAGGKGTRLHSKKNKLIHTILGKPVIQYVVDRAKEVTDKEVVVVISPDDPSVPEVVQDVQFAYQKERLGTADAIKPGLEFIEEGTLLVLLGDIPCLEQRTIEKFIRFHERHKMDLSVLSVEMPDSTGYGRIIREGSSFLGIVEEKDATEGQRRIKEINTGVYLFDVKKLKKHIGEVTNDNAQKEYYLTDMVKIFHQHGYHTGAYLHRNYEETVGINNRSQLAVATSIIQKRINEKWMLAGVTMIDPSSVYIDDTVELGKDIVLEPGTILRGKTVVEDYCHIGPFCVIENSKIGKGTTILQSTVLDSHLGEANNVGPFAYIRPDSHTGNQVKIGDFVEIKNATIGDHTKVPHLSYVGDADVGSHINIGCGVIFVNYDGVNKYRSTVEDGSFIGCNSNLIAPVKVEKGAYIAAGTTVTKTVPADALAVGRVKQKNLKDWTQTKKGLKK